MDNIDKLIDSKDNNSSSNNSNHDNKTSRRNEHGLHDGSGPCKNVKTNINHPPPLPGVFVFDPPKQQTNLLPANSSRNESSKLVSVYDQSRGVICNFAGSNFSGSYGKARYEPDVCEVKQTDKNVFTSNIQSMYDFPLHQDEKAFKPLQPAISSSVDPLLPSDGSVYQSLQPVPHNFFDVPSNLEPKVYQQLQPVPRIDYRLDVERNAEPKVYQQLVPVSEGSGNRLQKNEVKTYQQLNPVRPSNILTYNPPHYANSKLYQQLRQPSSREVRLSYQPEVKTYHQLKSINVSEFEQTRYPHSKQVSQRVFSKAPGIISNSSGISIVSNQSITDNNSLKSSLDLKNKNSNETKFRSFQPNKSKVYLEPRNTAVGQRVKTTSENFQSIPDVLNSQYHAVIDTSFKAHTIPVSHQNIQPSAPMQPSSQRNDTHNEFKLPGPYEFNLPQHNAPNKFKLPKLLGPNEYNSPQQVIGISEKVQTNNNNPLYMPQNESGMESIDTKSTCVSSSFLGGKQNKIPLSLPKTPVCYGDSGVSRKGQYHQETSSFLIDEKIKNVTLVKEMPGLIPASPYILIQSINKYKSSSVPSDVLSVFSDSKHQAEDLLVTKVSHVGNNSSQITLIKTPFSNEEKINNKTEKNIMSKMLGHTSSEISDSINCNTVENLTSQTSSDQSNKNLNESIVTKNKMLNKIEKSEDENTNVALTKVNDAVFPEDQALESNSVSVIKMPNNTYQAQINKQGSISVTSKSEHLYSENTGQMLTVNRLDFQAHSHLSPQPNVPDKNCEIKNSPLSTDIIVPPPHPQFSRDSEESSDQKNLWNKSNLVKAQMGETNSFQENKEDQNIKFQLTNNINGAAKNILPSELRKPTSEKLAETMACVNLDQECILNEGSNGSNLSNNAQRTTEMSENLVVESTGSVCSTNIITKIPNMSKTAVEHKKLPIVFESKSKNTYLKTKHLKSLNISSGYINKTKELKIKYKRRKITKTLKSGKSKTLLCIKPENKTKQLQKDFPNEIQNEEKEFKIKNEKGDSDSEKRDLPEDEVGISIRKKRKYTKTSERWFKNKESVKESIKKVKRKFTKHKKIKKELDNDVPEKRTSRKSLSTRVEVKYEFIDPLEEGLISDDDGEVVFLGFDMPDEEDDTILGFDFTSSIDELDPVNALLGQLEADCMTVECDPRTLLQAPPNTTACPQCSKTFDSHLKLVNHMQWHVATQGPNTESFVCTVCFRCFNTQPQLDKHFKWNHQGGKRFSCPLCPKRFTTSSYVKKHVETIHGEYNAEVIFSCGDCSLTFSTEKLLKFHEEKIHKKSLHQCDKCLKYFVKLSNLKRHKLSHEEDGQAFPCAYCNQKFSTRELLHSHWSVHSDKKAFKCDICNSRFTALNSLKRHRILHSGEKLFRCEICQRSFSLLNTLKTHLLIHTGARRFECKLCHKKFNRRDVLNAHQWVHTGEKKFQCDVCFQKFRWRHAVKSHKLIYHSTEKPFTCETCGKQFSHPDSFKKHAEVHAEKVYYCQICLKAFSRPSTLKAHILIHTDLKPFFCDICNRGFRSKSHLRNHFLVHTKEKPWLCKFCNKTYKDRTQLRRHKRVVHCKAFYKKILQNFSEKYETEENLELITGVENKAHNNEDSPEESKILSSEFNTIFHSEDHFISYSLDNVNQPGQKSYPS